MSREEERRMLFKQTIANDDGRRRRQETTRQIRKAKKDENLLKRRMEVLPITATNSDDTDTMSGGKKTLQIVADIPGLVASMRNPTATLEQKTDATRDIRRILSAERTPPVEEVLQAGVLPDLIQNLTAIPEAADLIFESAWALTNIASTDRTADVVNAGAVEPLIQLLRHSVPDVREQAGWCIGNIAGEGTTFRDYLLQQGALGPLLMNIQEPATMSLLGNVTWSVSNLCRGKPVPPLEMVAPAIPFLANVVRGNFPVEVMIDAVWALSYISDGADDRIQSVIDAGVVEPLIGLLSNKNSLLTTPTIRCLGNFVTGSEEQTQMVLDAGILEHLEELLESSRNSIRKETSWLASNIAAGSQNQIAMLMHRRGILQSIIDNAMNSSWEVRKEAIWTLSNICTLGDDVQVMGLVQFQGLQPLTEILSFQNADAVVLVAALDAIDHVLEVGDRHGKDYCTLVHEYNGVDYIEDLQEHPSSAVYEKIVQVIETYFGTDELEDENLAPEMTDTGTFGFGLNSPKQLFPTDASSLVPVFQFGDANRAF